MSSKQDEVLVKAFLDAKAAEQELLAKIDALLVEAREIRNSLNHAWSAYTKRDLPRDLGGSRPEHTAPSYNEIKEADEFMASGAAPAPRRVPPRRKKT